MTLIAINPWSDWIRQLLCFINELFTSSNFKKSQCKKIIWSAWMFAETAKVKRHLGFMLPLSDRSLFCLGQRWHAKRLLNTFQNSRYRLHVRPQAVEKVQNLWLMITHRRYLLSIQTKTMKYCSWYRWSSCWFMTVTVGDDAISH